MKVFFMFRIKSAHLTFKKLTCPVAGYHSAQSACSLVRCLFQWIGLRENLQETIDFPIKYGA